MSDPLQQHPDPPLNSLFGSTRAQAGAVAARSVGKRHAQILELLDKHGELTLFETAALLGLFDHQISGRFTELVEQGLIERTGKTKVKPDTGCACDVYRRRVETEAPKLDLGESLGYPDSLTFDGQIWERQPTIPSDPWPGLAYRQRGGGLVYRFHLVLCPGCAAPLRMVEETVAGQKRRTYHCLTPNCHRVWHPGLVSEPGQQPTLALVAKTL